ncbi:hypothetical protein E6W39_32455 [Kitasatospora acidiphila]|uniref:DUF7507 domain-containing protein n=1 Tax=Kitasatospora acidiphila TaxID=2567942 RepID=A0A540WAL7_9ACTN|nr:DUF11 domain-containing protein [Kitasatospora acidiphila]TQF06071.1 hypothetical protein E6W39_32455 [Kitasatospora acidiphila]
MVLGIGLSFGATGTAHALPKTRDLVKTEPNAGRQTRAAGSTLVNETFTGVDAPDFTGVGSACLTGAAEVPSPPAPGDHPLGGCDPGIGPVPPNNAAPYGYLRLTDSRNDQSGAVLYNNPVPANEGLNVTFDQWQYGSTTPNTPADGISFFLVNGDGALTHPGAFGGSLGYAQKLPDDVPSNTFLPGVDRGYLGVGLDVLGNYFGDWEHRGNGCNPRSPAGTGFRIPAPGANMVTVRGPGDGLEGYCFMTATSSNFSTSSPWPSTLPGRLQGPTTALPPGATPQEAEAALEESRRRVHIELSPAPNPVLTVSIDFNDGHGFQQVLHTPAPMPVPPTYKFGFAASTGLFTDEHLIRHVVVTSDQPLPRLNLVKQVVKPLPGDLVAGSRVPYQFVVTNSGGTTINGLTVNDPKIGPVSCPTTTLAPNETVTCTATYTVTAADVRHGSIDNTATATGTSDGETVTSLPSSESVPLDQPPGLEVEKATRTSGPYHVGQTVAFDYTVRNTGGAVLHDVKVNDDHVTGISCQSTTLQPVGSPGDSTTCTGSYTITQDDGTAGFVTNTATATGLTEDGQSVTSPETDATLPVGTPHVTLTKSADEPGPFFVGDTVHYSYTVQNTGTTELHGVLVTDDRVGGISCGTTDLTAGASTTCHGTYTVTQADVDVCHQTNPPGAPCHVTNIAVASGTDPGGNQASSDQATATVEVREHAPELSLAKRADEPGPFLVGDTVHYTYTARNTGNTELHNLQITDDHVTGISCDATDLAPGASTTCHGSYTVTQHDLDVCDTNGDAVCHVTNIATAHATDPSGNQTQSEEAVATVEVRERQASALTLAKAADEPGPFVVGDTVRYTYTVRNTGNTELHGVLVTDDHIADIRCDTTDLAPGAGTTCHGTYTITEHDLICDQASRCHVTNTAVATATDPSGNQVQSEEATHTIEVRQHAPALTLTKKADEPGPFVVGDTVHYTYTVHNTGNTKLHNLQITDNHVTGISCDTTDLAPGASTTCHGTYTIAEHDLSCETAHPDTCHITNLAVAGATDPSGNQINSDEAEFTIRVREHEAPHLTLAKKADEPGPFFVGDTVHYTYHVQNTGTTELHNVTVQDDHVSEITCSATHLAPGQSTTCHGTYRVTKHDLVCDKTDRADRADKGQSDTCHVTNTAVATATDPSGNQVRSDEAEFTITVCLEKKHHHHHGRPEE